MGCDTIKAKALVVAGLEVIAPGDAGPPWESLRDSGTVEKEFGIAEELPKRINTSVP